MDRNMLFSPSVAGFRLASVLGEVADLAALLGNHPLKLRKAGRVLRLGAGELVHAGLQPIGRVVRPLQLRLELVDQPLEAAVHRFLALVPQREPPVYGRTQAAGSEQASDGLPPVFDFHGPSLL
jgi:hypothetical protein